MSLFPLTNLPLSKRLKSRPGALQNALRILCVLALCAAFSACQKDDPIFEEGGQTVTNGGSDSTDDGSDDGNGTGGGGGGGSNGGGSTTVGGNGKASAFLSWDIPAFRENGEELQLSEIAGYEIVYRQLNEDSYTVITLREDNNTDSHTINNLDAGNYEFMIAVFDEDGLYSDYSDPVIASLVAN